MAPETRVTPIAGSIFETPSGKAVRVDEAGVRAFDKAAEAILIMVFMFVTAATGAVVVTKYTGELLPGWRRCGNNPCRKT